MALYSTDMSTRLQLESVQLRRHCNSTATATALQSIWHIISIFWVFCSKILRFGKFRVATTNAGHVTPRPIVNNKLESVQLQKHCISNAEGHCARRSGFFVLVWFENIVFGRFAKCAWQPPCGADTPTMRNAQARCGLPDFAQIWYVGSLLVPKGPAIVEIHLP